jgi:hypothetical protein
VHRGTALGACGLESFYDFIAVGARIDVADGRDDVAARAQHPAQIVQVSAGVVPVSLRGQRHVQHAIDIEGEGRFEIVRHADADLVPAQQRSDIDPVLLGSMGEDPGQLQLGVCHDGPQTRTSDVSGGPLQDA